jgi:hypothetical protein
VVLPEHLFCLAFVLAWMHHHSRLGACSQAGSVQELRCVLGDCQLIWFAQPADCDAAVH